MFGTDEDDKTATMTTVNATTAQTPASTETTTTTSSEPDSSCATMIEANPMPSEATATDPKANDQMAIDEQNYKVNKIN